MKITVVTVCLNAQDTIARTIESFCAQDHADKELLVVDGASTDATVQIARAFDRPDIVVLSEPDRGLYDAMNKGLGRFAGDAVGFLNADDRLADAGALSAIAGALQGADVCYGDLDIVAPAGPDQNGQRPIVRRWRATPWSVGGFRRGWMPAHPTFYCRRRVVEAIGGFDPTYGLAADYDFMLRALEIGGFAAAQIRKVLARMQDGGASAAGLAARVRHNLHALASRRHWLGSGLVDYALLAKPMSKLRQFALAGGQG